MRERSKLLLGPDENKVHPNENVPSVCFIKNIIKNPNIIVGDFTYYDDAETGGEDFEAHVVHLYPFLGDKLIIGKFVAIAKGVRFIMNGANHRMNGISTYPFNIFGNGWEEVTPTLKDLPLKGDTIIGNDVWIGENVTFLPGVHVGDGAIIGANSVVAKDIPAYSIAVGNPSRVVKKRFDEETITFLCQLKWWDYPKEIITKYLKAIVSNNIEELKKLEKEKFLQNKH